MRRLKANIEWALWTVGIKKYCMHCDELYVKLPLFKDKHRHHCLGLWRR